MPESAQERRANDETSSDEIRRLLRDSVTAFRERDSDLDRVRALRGKPPGFQRDIWRKIAENGWSGVLVPEDHGGANEILRNIIAKQVMGLP